MKLITITLNTELYKQTIGELPNCYLYGCTVLKLTETNEITEEDKKYAINQYWLRAKGTGGYKVNEKLDSKLFKFKLV